METTKNTTTTVGIEALGDFLAPPKGAGAYVKRHLTGKDINPSQAAQILGVNASTVLRLLEGSRLTTNMASKLYSHFGIEPGILFNLEAKANAFEAMHLAQNNAT
jgi:plasmid maintenance system antidote protein VapI